MENNKSLEINQYKNTHIKTAYLMLQHKQNSTEKCAYSLPYQAHHPPVLSNLTAVAVNITPIIMHPNA
jgi:hypothetical protein